MTDENQKVEEETIKPKKSQSSEIREHNTNQSNYKISLERDDLTISEVSTNTFSNRNDRIQTTDDMQQSKTAVQKAEGRTGLLWKLYIRLAWIPVMCFNAIQSYISPQVYRWCTKIDEQIVLGAFPVGYYHGSLIHHFNLTHVVSVVEPWELKLGRGIFTKYSQYRTPIKQLHVPVQDHWGTLEIIEIEKVLNFMSMAIDGEIDELLHIEDHEGESELDTFSDASATSDLAVKKRQKVTLNSSSSAIKQRKNVIYVHCKSGRGRSALIVACYLIKKYNWTAEEAVMYLKGKRRVVNIEGVKWKTLKEYEHAYRITDLKKLQNLYNVES